jgi:hypothetical protein
MTGMQFVVVLVLQIFIARVVHTLTLGVSNPVTANWTSLVCAGFLAGLVAGVLGHRRLTLAQAIKLGAAYTIVGHLVVGYFQGVQWTLLAVVVIVPLYSFVAAGFLILGSSINSTGSIEEPEPQAPESTSGPACPRCGTEYDPGDYRQDSPEKRCSKCRAVLQESAFQ